VPAGGSLKFYGPAAEETLQQIYDTISDKPEKMVTYKNALRPEDVWRHGLFMNSLLFVRFSQ